MFHLPVAKLTGAAVLTLSLAACMDISMEVEILSETEAKGTMTTTMAADVYEMVAAQQVEGEEGFCDEGELIETPESVSCVVTQSGPFGELELGEDGEGPMIEAIGGGQVRVSFPLGDLSEEIGQGMGAGEDPEMLAMMAAMFEGNSITMAVSGGRIVDTNMDVAADGLSASFVIPFAALLTGDVELPEEAYAIVQK
ncbi:hypothetical protein [Pelagibacterium limicola]|uniref:hypothetical protein n=1 Tax=Pelagibacterium limicola TaxID=2791022 RepID=UPI0018AFF4AA|nr:hypothetical protein [Pelagibacterium limicola]